jgi:hypothetical protein
MAAYSKSSAIVKEERGFTQQWANDAVTALAGTTALIETVA